MGKEELIKALGKAVVDRDIPPNEPGLTDEERNFVRRENIKNQLKTYADQLDIMYEGTRKAH